MNYSEQKTNAFNLSNYSDKQLLDEQALRSLMPDKKRLVENYLAEQSVPDMEEINFIAKDFQSSDTDLARTVVLIPIAAHSEHQHIQTALGNYSKQITDKQFSVVLYPNSTLDAPQTDTDKTIDLIHKSIEQFPSLDIRTTELGLFEKPIIGRLRKNLWDSAILLSYYEGAFDDKDEDVIGINHDIDTISMSPRYISHIQNHYQKKRNLRRALNLSHTPLDPTSTAVKHAYDPTRPNTSKVVFWQDLTIHQLGKYGVYEEGLVVPFSFYAQRQGFNPESSLRETLDLVNGRIKGRVWRANMETSPRRFADRLHITDLSNIWTEDSFGANDNCRNESVNGDIAEERAFELIDSSLDEKIPYFFIDAVHKYWNDPRNFQINKALDKKKHLAMSVLNRIDKSGVLANKVDTKYDVDEIALDASCNFIPKIFK
ncbi:MAG: hypothetical protein WAW80_03970 [Candidatus Saccharimonadales bacterium]